MFCFYYIIEYFHYARLMFEPPGIISVLWFRSPGSEAAALPFLFGHILLPKWDSFEKSEKCWYQSCYVTVYILSMKKRDYFFRLLLLENVQAVEAKTKKKQ